MTTHLGWLPFDFSPFLDICFSKYNVHQFLITLPWRHLWLSIYLFSWGGISLVPNMTLTLTWLAMQEHVLRKLWVLLVQLMSSFAWTQPAGNTFREWIHSEEEVFAHLNWDKLLFRHQILNWTLGFDSTSLMSWKYSFYCYSPFSRCINARPSLYCNQNHSSEWYFSTTWREKQKIKKKRKKNLKSSCTTTKKTENSLST